MKITIVNILLLLIVLRNSRSLKLKQWDYNIKNLFFWDSQRNIIYWSFLLHLLVLLISEIRGFDFFNIITLEYTFDLNWLLNPIAYFFILVYLILQIFIQRKQYIELFIYEDISNKLLIIFVNLIFALIKIFIFYSIIIIPFSVIKYWDITLKSYNLNLLDWCYSDDVLFNLSFKNGIYFSILSSLIFTFFIFRRLYYTIKTNNISVIRFVFISFILCIGIALGLYSILNIIYHLINFNSFLAYIKTEFSSHTFPLRLSSIYLLYLASLFVYKDIFNKKIRMFNRSNYSSEYNIWDNSFGTLSNSNYSTLYFAQIGFYILMLFIIYLAHIIQYNSYYIDISNWAFFYIIDDFGIIHTYSEHFKNVLSSHKNRIDFFNFLLFILGVIISFKISIYLFLMFLLITFLFLDIKYSNNARIQISS